MVAGLEKIDTLIANEVDDAMFLSEAPLPQTVSLGLLTSIPSAALAQARAHVLELTRRMT